MKIFLILHPCNLLDPTWSHSHRTVALEIPLHTKALQLLYTGRQGWWIFNLSSNNTSSNWVTEFTNKITCSSLPWVDKVSIDGVESLAQHDFIHSSCKWQLVLDILEIHSHVHTIHHKSTTVGCCCIFNCTSVLSFE